MNNQAEVLKLRFQVLLNPRVLPVSVFSYCIVFVVAAASVFVGCCIGFFNFCIDFEVPGGPRLKDTIGFQLIPSVIIFLAAVSLCLNASSVLLAAASVFLNTVSCF